VKLELEAGLRTTHFGRALEVHDSIGSTNDRARTWATEGAPHGAMVIAHEQTAGRGRRGRTWHSPRGAGLYVSFVARPEVEPALAPTLTLMTAVAVQDALTAGGAEVGIKWPNDLLARDGRKKVAGILVEVTSAAAGIAHAIIGVGINLLERERPDAIAEYATSLEALGAATDASQVATQIANRVERYLEELVEYGPESIIAAWKDKALGVGEAVELHDAGAVHRGTLYGVDATGALIIDTVGGPQTLRVGDLHLAGAPKPRDR